MALETVASSSGEDIPENIGVLSRGGFFSIWDCASGVRASEKRWGKGVEFCSIENNGRFVLTSGNGWNLSNRELKFDWWSVILIDGDWSKC